jgi:hypothetical protein
MESPSDKPWLNITKEIKEQINYFSIRNIDTMCLHNSTRRFLTIVNTSEKQYCCTGSFFSICSNDEIQEWIQMCLVMVKQDLQSVVLNTYCKHNILTLFHILKTLQGLEISIINTENINKLIKILDNEVQIRIKGLDRKTRDSYDF